MSLRSVLLKLAKAVADQAEADPAFAATLAVALGMDEPAVPAKTPVAGKTAAAKKGAAKATANPQAKPPAKKKVTAPFDPAAVIFQGEGVLRARLAALTLEQLKAIVAQHRLDPNRKVTRTAAAEQIVAFIVKQSLAVVQKGDAFRA
jgi:hypothetical protein